MAAGKDVSINLDSTGENKTGTKAWRQHHGLDLADGSSFCPHVNEDVQPHQPVYVRNINKDRKKRIANKVMLQDAVRLRGALRTCFDDEYFAKNVAAVAADGILPARKKSLGKTPRSLTLKK